MRKRTVRLSSTEIKSHLLTQKNSGKTVIQYCKEHDLAKQTFYSWRAAFNNKGMKSSSKFIPLEIEHTAISEQVLASIKQPNGCCIEFYSSASAALIAQTAKLL